MANKTKLFSLFFSEINFFLFFKFSDYVKICEEEIEQLFILTAKKNKKWKECVLQKQDINCGLIELRAHSLELIEVKQSKAVSF